MTILERNLRAFNERRGGSSFLAAAAEPRDFSILPTPSGNPTALYRGIYLHSRHDPGLEAARLVDRELEGKTPETILVLGFGLGYQAELLLEKAPGAELFIVEPDVSLFRAVIAVRDLSRVLSSDRVSFFFGASPEAVASAFDSRDGEVLLVFKLRSVYLKDVEYYDRLERLLSSVLRRKEINRNTLARFGKLWVRNLVRNLPRSASVRGIREIEGLFKGIPALVLAAGPSLDTILPALPEMRKRCLVIAVDTSLRACLRSGVDPDFTVVVDPQYWNTRHLDWAGRTESVLVSESSTHPRIFRTRFGAVYFCSSIFPMGEYLERRTTAKGRLGAGGSVSTSAWDFARILGCGPVYMAGLDLGFPGLQTHFSGSFFEHRVHTASRRLLTGETSSFLALHDAGPFSVPSNDGRKVLTDNRLIVYRQWFESQMRLHPECDTFNLSPGGAAMDGMPFATADRLLELPQIRNTVDERMLAARRAPEATADAGNIALAVESLVSELEALDGLARSGMEASARLREAFVAGLPLVEHLDGLEATDRKILSFQAKDVAGFLLSAVRKELAHPGTAGGMTAIENSETLYRELHESVVFHLGLLKRTGSATRQ